MSSINLSCWRGFGPLRPTWPVAAIFAVAILFAGASIGATQHPPPPSLDELTQNFYESIVNDPNYTRAKTIADKFVRRGIEDSNDETRVRGLIRLAYIDLRFGKSKNQWENKVDQCRKLLSEPSLAQAEFLMLHGHMIGKWKNNPSEGLNEIQKAIKIASDLRADELQIHAYSFASQLSSLLGNIHQAVEFAYMAKRIADHVGTDACAVVALNQCVLIHLMLGQTTEIREEVHQLVSLNPEGETGQRALWMLGENDDYEKKLIESALNYETRPESFANSKVLGPIYWQLGKGKFDQNRKRDGIELIRKAIPHLENCKELCSLEYAKFYVSMYEIESNGATTERLEKLLTSFEKHPELGNQPKYVFAIANAFFELGNRKAGALWQQKALSKMNEKEIRNLTFINSKSDERWKAELANRDQVKLNEEQATRSLYSKFFVFGTGLLTLLALSVIFTKQRFVSRQKRELERLVEQRTQSLSLAMEKAEKADKAKSDFLARINHEIRNPLTAILGFSSILQAELELDSDEKTSCLEGLQSSSSHLHELVNDILEASRVERVADDEIAANTFDLEQLAASVYNHQTLKVKEKPIQFGFQLAPKVERLVVGDEAKIRQILGNVIGNAIKFTDEGAIDVVLEVNSTGGDTGELKVTVQDTGRGIPSGEEQHVFDRFSHASTNDNELGSGIGLYTTKLLVSQLAGNISLESSIGDGTTVELSIPIEFGQRILDQSHSQIELSAKPERILVIDDQLLVSESISMQLKNLGYVTLSSNQPESVVDLIKSWNPSVVLLDLRMPRLNGFDVYEQIKCMEQRPCVIAMTGDATLETKRECMSAGFDHFLTKPFQMEDLQRIFISRASSSREAENSI